MIAQDPYRHTCFVCGCIIERGNLSWVPFAGYICLGADACRQRERERYYADPRMWVPSGI